MVKYKKEVERKGTEYKVLLTDYIKFEFDTHFEPVEIKGETALPESVLPLKIVAYVKSISQSFHR